MGTLYENIMSLCETKSVKPGKMCNDIEISRGLITDLKMGRKSSITVDTAQKIADYFGVSVDCVLGKEKKEKSPTPEGVELIPGYSKLSDANRAIVDSMIAQLLAAQPKD